MIRTLRAYFLTRALREKLMIVAILGVAVVMWAIAYSSRASQLIRDYRATNVRLASQQKTLAQRSSIEAITQEAASQLVPANTLDAAKLYVVVSAFAQESGITTNISPAGGKTSGRFSVHPLVISLNNVNWDNFKDFYRRIESRAPYMAVTELSFEPAANNSGQIRGAMRVQSFEVRLETPGNGASGS